MGKAVSTEFGLEDHAWRLNWTLLNLRKAGQLAGIASRRTYVPDQWRFSFASELSAQVLQFRFGFSVDRLLADPKLAQRFDSLARALAPGFASFDYRWAALNVRKRGWRQCAEPTAPFRFSWSLPIPFGQVSSVPEGAGIYCLVENGASTLFIGNTHNLRLAA